MRGIVIAALLAVGLSGCSGFLTSAERTSLATGAGDTLHLAVQKVRDLGYDPIGADESDLRLAQDVCELVDTGSPLIVSAVNVIVTRHNADAAVEEQIEPWTVAEFRAELEAGCKVVEALLMPSAPVPEPKPEV